jgi:Flp pilus assembly pilin Flp
MRLGRIFSFRDREEGAFAVEYAILVASIAFAIGSGSLLFGERLAGKFNNAAK